jgi:hypothetical protein
MLKVPAEMKLKAYDPHATWETLLVTWGTRWTVRGSNPRTGKRSLLQNNQTSSEADITSYSTSTGGSLEVKWPWREADHSPTSSGGVKNEWRCNSTPPFISSRCI